jgi:TolB-like protein/DNA-binding winged helix-turn-helix (wHTH) protein/Tfp pilus assembly protein PilF
MSATKSTTGRILASRFGPYELGRDGLRKFGLRVKLERKPLLLLIALVERAGEVVTRSELQDLLWGEDLHVDFDKGLNVAVTKVRAALNDSVEKPKYIETVAGAGYQFIAAVERVSAPRPAASVLAEPAVTSIRSVADGTTSDIKHDDLVPGTLVVAPQSWLQRRNVLLAVAAGLVVALLSVAFTTLRSRWLPQPYATHPRKLMLVVLPFENLSGDPSQDYLSDGITEELSEQLGNLAPQRLGVIGRTSAMTYKHSSRTIAQIGTELGVGYILEGSIRREGRKLRVTAQLVQVSDQAHVWAHDYDRELRDLMQVEDEVASDIARQVGLSMAVAQPVKSLHPHIPNPDAHEEYLVARYYWNKRTPEGWDKAEQHFRRAVKKDPQYAAAYAGLAECASRPEALLLARKAVELDPASGEAYAALGWVELFREWEFDAAAEALKTAIRLDPNYAPAHHIYSGVLQVNGRLKEAIDEEKQAVAVDPLWLIARASLAEELSAAGQPDDAIGELNEIVVIEPRYPKAHETFGLVYARMGKYKDAIREYEISEQYGGGKLTGPIGYAYARSGNKKLALKALAELKELEKKSRSEDAYADRVLVEIGLGNYDEALALLEEEYEKHNHDGLLGLKVDPVFDPLRSDPRFQKLVRQMKFSG